MRTHLHQAIGIFAALAAVVCAHTTASAQSTTTVQALRIERPQQPGVFITLAPPSTALPVAGYTIVWPAVAPTNGQVLGVSGAVSPFQLTWSSSVTSTLELATTSTGGLRRVNTVTEGGLVGNVGTYANDFSGSRSNGAQTASGDYSLIGGGSNNTASGNYSLVLGGTSNTASGLRSVVGGGQSNQATGTGSSILSGYQNQNAGQNGVIGGGENNQVLAGGTNGFLGGGQNNIVSGGNGVVGGGTSNTASGYASAVVGGNNNRATDTAAFVGGGNNNLASAPYSSVVGGQNNTASGRLSFIGGGDGNTASGVLSVIGGGYQNSVSGQGSAIGGGQANSITGTYSFVGSGQSNSITGGSNSVITGGNSNAISSASYASIGGGLSNTIQADYATIPGGRSMTIATGGTGSFGFNGGNSNISVSAAQTFVIANADLWLANNDNVVRELRFYEAYNTSGTFPGGSTNYVSVKAPNSTNSNLNNTYTLPDRIGTVRQILRIATGPSTTAATLEWGPPSNMVNANTVDVTADNQAITTTQLDYITFIRLRGDGNPANRTVTLANGVVDGQQLVIKAVGNGNVAYGVELVDGAADNLWLAGNVQLADGDTITLMWDATSTIWSEISRSNN